MQKVLFYSLQSGSVLVNRSEISVTETIMETEIIDPALMETMVFVVTKII